jgi:alpha(1,3/1,4) fucosyltransferase
MKKVLFYNYDSNTNKKLFSTDDLDIGDDLLLPIKKTRANLINYKIDCFTSVVTDFSNIDLFVILDFPHHILNLVKKAKSFNIPVILIHMEGHAIIKDPLLEKKNRELFDYVLSWYSPYKAFFKNKFKQIHFTFPEENVLLNETINKNIICISGNKFSSDHNELYSLRRKWIFDFNKNFPKRFDLYGFGWENYIFEGGHKFSNLLNKVNLRLKIFSQDLLVYKGTIDRKRDVLKMYTFSFIIENVSQDYWITEKIFDCFINGVIPIYLGCKNLKDYVPSNCYIDLNSFDSADDLVSYIDNLSDNEIFHFKKNITKYLKSPNATPFTNKHFMETLSDVILKQLNISSNEKS